MFADRFSKIHGFWIKTKEIIYPVDKKDAKLLLLMGAMLFCILFNFGALRSIKDALIITSIGAEAISFLKLFFVLPATLLFTIFYVKISNLLSIEYIFYIIVSILLVFFFIFTFLIYPNQSYYHLDQKLVESLCIRFSNLKWFIKILGMWSYALMYVFSELWSSVIINLMFWQFANHIFNINQAKKLYPIIGMIGNLGLVLAGNILLLFSNFVKINSNTNSSLYQIMLKPLMICIIMFGVLSIILFYIINKIITKLNNSKSLLNEGYDKTKLTVTDSIRLILKSRYIGCIMLLILCYGLSINILEGPWKAKVNQLYPNTIDYVKFMGKFNVYMGISCVLFMILGSNIIRNVEWVKSALITPAVISITGFLFFIFVILSKNINNTMFNPVYGAVLFGAAQNILSKSTKYSLFDSTKEIAYIPLPLELKIKGKAAAEIIGSKLGESMSAFLQSIIFIIIPDSTFDTTFNLSITVFIIITAVWFWSVIKLSYEYNSLIKSNKVVG